jgi:hypothetical protein
MKKLCFLFAALAIILSDIMCAVVAFNYRDLLCSIEHAGFSAPANTAFLYAIPFAAGIIICAITAYTFYRKS